MRSCILRNYLIARAESAMAGDRPHEPQEAAPDQPSIGQPVVWVLGAHANECR